MLYLDKNLVRIACDKIGGVTRTYNEIGVSNGAVHFWIKNRRVSNINYARKLAELSGMKVEQLRPV